MVVTFVSNDRTRKEELDVRNEHIRKFIILDNVRNDLIRSVACAHRLFLMENEKKYFLIICSTINNLNDLLSELMEIVFESNIFKTEIIYIDYMNNLKKNYNDFYNLYEKIKDDFMMLKTFSSNLEEKK